MVAETNFAGRGATLKNEIANILSYDPAIGEFRWKRASANGKTPVGGLAGSINKQGYLQIGVCGRTRTAQQLAWLLSYGYWPVEVDHINGDPLDNRLVNLRECTPAENAQNRSDSVVGAYLFRGRWRAMIRVAGRKRFLGDFAAKESAVEAYRDAKAQHHHFAPTLRATGT